MPSWPVGPAGPTGPAEPAGPAGPVAPVGPAGPAGPDPAKLWISSLVASSIDFSPSTAPGAMSLFLTALSRMSRDLIVPSLMSLDVISLPATAPEVAPTTRVTAR